MYSTGTVLALYCRGTRSRGFIQRIRSPPPHRYMSHPIHTPYFVSGAAQRNCASMRVTSTTVPRPSTVALFRKSLRRAAVHFFVALRIGRIRNPVGCARRFYILFAVGVEVAEECFRGNGTSGSWCGSIQGGHRLAWLSGAAARRRWGQVICGSSSGCIFVSYFVHCR